MPFRDEIFTATFEAEILPLHFGLGLRAWAMQELLPMNRAERRPDNLHYNFHWSWLYLFPRMDQAPRPAKGNPVRQQ